MYNTYTVSSTHLHYIFQSLLIFFIEWNSGNVIVFDAIIATSSNPYFFYSLLFFLREFLITSA